VDLVRWLLCWHNWRPGGAIRGCGEYWMGRRESGLDRKFEAPACSPRLSRLRPTLVGSEETSFEMCIGAYGISWGPANLLASCDIELDDTLPPYGCHTG
jgi:hypothetical protein